MYNKHQIHTVYPVRVFISFNNVCKKEKNVIFKMCQLLFEFKKRKKKPDKGKQCKPLTKYKMYHKQILIQNGKFNTEHTFLYSQLFFLIRNLRCFVKIVICKIVKPINTNRKNV